MDTKLVYYNWGIFKLYYRLQFQAGDKQSPAIDLVRQLLPTPKKQVDMLCCEQHKSLADKAHRNANPESGDKKQVDILVKFKVCMRLQVNICFCQNFKDW